MVTRLIVALAFVAVLPAGPAPALEFKVCALVQARAAAWPKIPDNARIDPQRLSFKRKVFLESRKAIPVWAPGVKRALAEAVKGLKAGDRKRTAKVLDAIGSWSAETLTEDPSSLPCPTSWRTAAQVLRDRRGNAFELVRALTAMLRAAGIPARPTFNGVPVIYLYVTPAGKRGFWTVWDPRHPSGSFRRLPVLWLPLRAGEVPLISTKPKGLACRPAIEGRRFASQGEATRTFKFLKAAGRFPDKSAELLPADTKSWWEVWAIGAEVVPEPQEAFSAMVPLPFIGGYYGQKDISFGTREHGVWVSAPKRLKRVEPPHAQTDQRLGGLVLTLQVHFRAAKPSVPPDDA